jgi:hypothetical protein
MSRKYKKLVSSRQTCTRLSHHQDTTGTTRDNTHDRATIPHSSTLPSSSSATHLVKVIVIIIVTVITEPFLSSLIDIVILVISVLIIIVIGNLIIVIIIIIIAPTVVVSSSSESPPLSSILSLIDVVRIVCVIIARSRITPGACRKQMSSGTGD